MKIEYFINMMLEKIDFATLDFLWLEKDSDK